MSKLVLIFFGFVLWVNELQKGHNFISQQTIVLDRHTYFYDFEINANIYFFQS